MHDGQILEQVDRRRKVRLLENSVLVELVWLRIDVEIDRVNKKTSVAGCMNILSAFLSPILNYNL